ncbi:hypothetical protein ACFC63_09510 [Streptomyces albidoflavus]
MHEDPAGTEAARWYRGRMVTGPFAPFDPAELALLEAETGLPLPAAYRAFLEVGGGRLEYAVHLPACAPEPLQSFNRLYRLGRDEHGEHGYVTDTVRTEVAAGFDAYLDALVIDPQAAADVWAEAARKSPADARRRSVEAWLDAGLPGWRGRGWADGRSA